MTLQDEDIDEDLLDDPIRLIDENEGTVINDKTQGGEFYDLTESDGDFPVEKKAKARPRQVSVTLPVTFFEIPSNVLYLNECRTFGIKVVDCDKHPWFYRKYYKPKDSTRDLIETYDINNDNTITDLYVESASQKEVVITPTVKENNEAELTSDLIHIERENKKNNNTYICPVSHLRKQSFLSPLAKEVNGVDMHMAGAQIVKPRIRPVDIAPYIAQPNKLGLAKFMTEKNCVSKTKDLVKKTDITEKITAQIDFKRNKGLVGLTIVKKMSGSANIKIAMDTGANSINSDYVGDRAVEKSDGGKKILADTKISHLADAGNNNTNVYVTDTKTVPNKVDLFGKKYETNLTSKVFKMSQKCNLTVNDYQQNIIKNTILPSPTVENAPKPKSKKNAPIETSNLIKDQIQTQNVLKERVTKSDVKHADKIVSALKDTAGIDIFSELTKSSGHTKDKKTNSYLSSHCTNNPIRNPSSSHVAIERKKRSKIRKPQKNKTDLPNIFGKSIEKCFSNSHCLPDDKSVKKVVVHVEERDTPQPSKNITGMKYINQCNIPKSCDSKLSRKNKSNLLKERSCDANIVKSKKRQTQKRKAIKNVNSNEEDKAMNYKLNEGITQLYTPLCYNELIHHQPGQNSNAAHNYPVKSNGNAIVNEKQYPQVVSALHFNKSTQKQTDDDVGQFTTSSEGQAPVSRLPCPPYPNNVLLNDKNYAMGHPKWISSCFPVSYPPNSVHHKTLQNNLFFNPIPPVQGLIPNPNTSFENHQNYPNPNNMAGLSTDANYNINTGSTQQTPECNDHINNSQPNNVKPTMPDMNAQNTTIDVNGNILRHNLPIIDSIRLKPKVAVNNTLLKNVIVNDIPGRLFVPVSQPMPHQNHGNYSQQGAPIRAYVTNREELQKARPKPQSWMVMKNPTNNYEVLRQMLGNNNSNVCPNVNLVQPHSGTQANINFPPEPWFYGQRNVNQNFQNRPSNFPLRPPPPLTNSTPTYNISIPPPPLPQTTPQTVVNATIIGSNQDGLVRKINIHAVAKSVEKDKIETQSKDIFTTNDTPVNSKREMLEELTKVTIMAHTKKPSTNSSLPETLPNILQEPKPCPLSKKVQFDALSNSKHVQKHNISVTESKGYSPPILPIPTYEKTFEMLAQARLADRRFATDEISRNSKYKKKCFMGRYTNISGAKKRKLSFDDDNKLKKISLDDYKKRAKNGELCEERREKNINLEKVAEANKDYMEPGVQHFNSEQDLGYDSDSTMKLY